MKKEQFRRRQGFGSLKKIQVNRSSGVASKFKEDELSGNKSHKKC